MTESTRTISSPIGPLLLRANDTSLLGIDFVKETSRHHSKSAVLDLSQEQLDEYFARTRTIFSLPLEPVGTPFQMSVWVELSALGYGEVLTYTGLAARLHRPRSARAVANALGANPLPIVIPCHRILAADGIGGYGGGVDKKRVLLALEASSNNGH
jgi:methylated-DNA-[protein]-cysteine S-methyltransferase